MGNSPQDEDEEEDEETLQLKLQEIQARLRLKRLQSAKAKEDASQGSHTAASTSGQVPNASQINRTRRATTPGEEQNDFVSMHSGHVPASPVRKLQAPQDPISPRRVLLGIDKGLTAKDISLKRVPSHKNKYLTTSRSTTLLAKPDALAGPTSAPSFNDRLANARAQEAADEEKKQRIKEIRSSNFGMGKTEMEMYKSKAVDLPDNGSDAPTFSREEIVPQSFAQFQGQNDPFTSDLSQPKPRAPRKKPVPPGEVAEDDATSFEPYSKFHLKKRILPHTVLTRQIRNMKAYDLPQLLKKVKAPDYQLPDDEQDIVVFAIVGKKSDPRAHKPVEKKGGQTDERGKFMIITLVDLKWEVDLFLFNGGFERFWKITEGTVIAILNPNIMPPPPARAATGKFSLVINSDGDTILEIGLARDLGYCQSVKKDGNLCSAWVNWKKTHFCEFHSNSALNRQRKTRVELNSSGFGDRKKHSQLEVYQKQENQRQANATYDRSTGTHWYSSSQSAADLLDGKDRGLTDQRDKQEYMKRRLAAKEKESEMMKKLGRIGNGAGKEYMERAGALAAGSSSQTNISDEPDAETKLDAAALGLLSTGQKIHLSPIKRKRPPGSQTSTLSGTSRPAFGWGSSLKDKLAKMKEGEKLRTEDDPPQRKKTRFITEKGIREAGRESLGVDLSRKGALDDDDDELLIIG